MNKNKVWSPSGLINGPVNSLVGKDESIIDYDSGQGSVVTDGVRGKDTKPSIAQDGDNIVIAGNDKDYIGALSGKYTGNKLLTFAQLAKPFTQLLRELNKIEERFNKEDYGKNSSLAKNTMEVLMREILKAKLPLLNQLKEITDRQEQQHNMEQGQHQQMPGYAKGKSESKTKVEWNSYSTRIPWWLRAIPNLAGLGLAAAQGWWWGNQDLHRPDIYALNPYEARALNTLASLRYNPLPALIAANQAERRAVYNTEQAGGISGPLKYLARTALGLGAMLNASNVYTTKQEADNKYKAAYAEAALKAGDSAAARRLASNQYNDTAFAMAHGRKVKGIELAGYNALVQLLNWYLNEFKYRTWKDAMKLYIEDQRILRDALDAARNGAKPNLTAASTQSVYNPNLELKLNPKTLFFYDVLNNVHGLRTGSVKTPNYKVDDPLTPYEGGFPSDYRWVNYLHLPQNGLDWNRRGIVSGATPISLPTTREMVETPPAPGQTADYTDTPVYVSDGIPFGYDTTSVLPPRLARAQAKRERNIPISDPRDGSRYTSYFNYYRIPYRFPYSWTGRAGVQGVDLNTFNRSIPYYYYSADGSPVYSPNAAYPDIFGPQNRWNLMMFDYLR